MAQGVPCAAGLGSAQFVCLQKGQAPSAQQGCSSARGLQAGLQLSYFCALNYAGKAFVQHHIVFVCPQQYRAAQIQPRSCWQRIAWGEVGEASCCLWALFASLKQSCSEAS